MKEFYLNNGNGQDDVSPEIPVAKPSEKPKESEAQMDVAPEDSATKSVTRMDVVHSIFTAYSDEGTDEQRIGCNDIIKLYLKQLVNQHDCCSAYNILILYDYNTLVKSDADRIYNAVTKFTEPKPILLVLLSSGGVASSAYLIGKLCIDNSGGRFIVTVPRMAKSAATLLCCAAKEIHMGSLSELGPIDPQIEGLPTLGLKYSVEHIAELVKRYPASSDMFAKYLHYSLELIHLGYYERVAESASQYAERLLSHHTEVLSKQPKAIAEELVYKYKDHGFVIDKSEAEEIFGKEVVKANTKEYELGNSLYMGLSFIYRLADMVGHDFYFTGSLDSDPVFTKKRQPNQ